MTNPVLPRVPKRLDPIDGGRPMDEQLLAMIVSLTSEITVLRARLDTCERLLADNGTLESGAIDAYTPDEGAAAARQAMRKATLDKVFRPLREAALAELNALEEGNPA